MSGVGGGIVSTIGAFNGVPLPKRMAGLYFIPPHLFTSDSGQAGAITAARYYYVPMYLDGLTTYAGAWFYNSGAGDNGKNVKMAAFSEAATGGPGALAKSFGTVTLTGAAALRSISSAWTPVAGWYYLALVSDTAPSLYAMQPGAQYTAAGMVGPNNLAEMLGKLSVGAPTGSPAASMPAGFDVAGVYANFPEANALTPTIRENEPPLMGLFT